MSIPPPSLIDVVVGKYYQVKYKIGSGSFGEIYLGLDIRTSEKCAVKVECKDTKYPQLLEEFKVYRALKAAAGLPAVYWCGNALGAYNVMVMELLGDSLETLYNKCNRKFSLKTVTMLAIQLLHRIEYHHTNHYLHRDIKPDNFLMGLKHNAHTLYLIDMGLCKQYREPDTLTHIPYRENKKLIGTPRYASINTHLGVEQCRRDDLESIGYMLMYFLNGKLPWQGLKARTKQEKYDKISNKKMNISIDTLCKNVPQQFAVYLTYTRNLRFIQKPDYKYLRGLFYDLFRQQGFKDDCVYDWMLIKQQQQQAAKKAPVAAAGAVTPSNRSKPVSGVMGSQQAIWDLTPGPQNQMLLNTAAVQKKAEELSDGEDEEDDNEDDGASQERIDEKVDEQPSAANQQQQQQYWPQAQMQGQQQQQPFLGQLSASSPSSRPFQQTVPNLHVQTSSSYHTMQSPPPVPLPQMPFSNAQYIHPTNLPSSLNRAAFPATNSTQAYLSSKAVASSPIVVRQYMYGNGSGRAEDESGDQPPTYSATFPNGSPQPQSYNNQTSAGELLERLEQSEGEKKELKKRVVELEKQIDRFRQENAQLKRHVQQQQQQAKPYSPVPQASVAFNPSATTLQQLHNATFSAQQQALQRSSLQLTQITQQIRDQFIQQQQQQQAAIQQTLANQQQQAQQAQQAMTNLSSQLAASTKRKYTAAVMGTADMQRVGTPRSSAHSGTPSPLGDEDEPASKRRNAQHVY